MKKQIIIRIMYGSILDGMELNSHNYLQEQHVSTTVEPHLKKLRDYWLPVGYVTLYNLKKKSVGVTRITMSMSLP